MNKSKILALVIGVLILCEALGLIYFASKTYNLSRKNQALAAKIETFQPGYAKMSRESEEAGAKSREAVAKHKEMAKELESVKADRENILAQTKTLLANPMRAQELEDELGKVKASIQPIESEKQKIKEQNLLLKAHVKKLKDDRTKLTAEREMLKADNDKLQNNTMVRELNSKIAGLQKELKSNGDAANKEKNELAADLKAAEKKIGLLTAENAKLTAGKDELTAKVEEQENGLAEAVRKNKAFEQEIRELPAKFVEVSRQNKVLLKQTAGMHYNMGVFYTKQREYDRAAAEFAKALEIDPDDAYAHFNLGYIYAEYSINRHKAMDHFRHFLRLAKGDDPDVNWARKYLLTWETYDGKRPVQ